MINDTTCLHNVSRKYPALLSFLVTAILITTLCLAFDPQWQTNDDVGMSMIAHGYGMAAYGSPNLVFSNVLWGYLVRSIPTINGVLGYSLATMAVLLLVGWAILYFLLRLGVGYLLGLLVVILLITGPTLFPQFTINAGLLTLAAVVGWQVYARFGGVGNLVVACLFAFFGYLERSQEFLLILGISLPLLPWRVLRERRRFQLAILLLGIGIVSAEAIDRWSYRGQEWQHFLEIQKARLPIIDFGASKYLKQHPEITARHGYSDNDIDLVYRWFFVDPKIADAKSLNAMMDELGPVFIQQGNFKSGLDGILMLKNKWLFPLLLAAVILSVLLPRWPVGLAWLLSLSAMFAMGVMGRPGQMRVYIPMVSMLFIAPLVAGQLRDGFRRRMAALTLYVACVGNAVLLVPEALAASQEMQQVQKDMKSLPVELMVTWGAAFPYESAFPVFQHDHNSRSLRLYSLSTSQLAPYSVVSAEQRIGHGMIERLRTAEGVSVIMNQKARHMEVLRVYCLERFGSNLREISTHETASITVHQVSCEPNE